MSIKWESDEVVQRCREYLKIPSVHPNPNYHDCVVFLKRQADLLDLPVAVIELVLNKPVVVITWKGMEPELPTILLNSHMDVVPVYEEHWKFPPFDAHITEDGWIYARGSQDMKSIGMMHLVAVRRLKAVGVKLKRTVHISFVPDEEIGSADGMRKFSESDEFRKLNVGFELDESIPSANGTTFNAYNGERTSRQIKITCKGEPGHGATICPGTAGEKIYFIINKFMELRAIEKKKLDAGAELGDVITINMTKLEGGVQVNVLPEKLSVTFDIRIPPSINHAEFENTLLNWCKEAGDNVTMDYYIKNPEIKSTKIDGSVPFWNTLQQTITDMGLEIKCDTCPGATDARFIRRQDIPAICFSPLLNTPLLLHAHNERLNVDEYKKGIEVMKKVLYAVANT